MKCAVCGAENEDNALFCYRCGSALKPTNTAATGPTVNLSRGETPPFGTPAPQPDEGGARVYEVPAAPVDLRVSTADRPASPPPYAAPDAGQSTVPGYHAPATVTSLPQQQSSTALIALILGILSFVGFSLLTAIPAVILGRNARREITASGGRITGEGLAQAGIILGWINIALRVLGFCAFCVLPIMLAALGSR